jgi:hypothetical protein
VELQLEPSLRPGNAVVRRRVESKFGRAESQTEMMSAIENMNLTLLTPDDSIAAEITQAALFLLLMRVSSAPTLWLHQDDFVSVG